MSQKIAIDRRWGVAVGGLTDFFVSGALKRENHLQKDLYRPAGDRWTSPVGRGGGTSTTTLSVRIYIYLYLGGYDNFFLVE